MRRYIQHLIPQDARDYLAIGSLALFSIGEGLAQYGFARTPDLSIQEKEQMTLERALDVTPDSTIYGLGLTGVGMLGIFASIAPWPRREEIYATFGVNRVQNSYSAAPASK